MTRYKMIARDVDVSFSQYRSWVVNDTPDFTGDRYIGPKGGTNPFVDIVANAIVNNSLVVDFNLPQPENWIKTKRQLPESIYDSHLAVIDGYIYLFGGNFTDKIFRASTGNPTTWIDTGAKLPSPLYGSQLGIIEDRVYLFGGNNGTATNVIYSASLFDPLTWVDSGATLPRPLYHSQLCMADGYMYLLGGQNKTGASVNSILMAKFDEPLVWTDGYISITDGYTYPDGYSLSDNLYGSQLGIILPYAYLFGGIGEDNLPTTNIYRARLNQFESWTLVGNLPIPVAFAQFITIGMNGYLYSTSSANATQILKCDLSDPLTWEVLEGEVPGVLYQAQSAVIDDRLLLLGGNGNTAIFADTPKITYPYNSVEAVNYGDITRTQYSYSSYKPDLIKIIGFPYWRTDYYNESPIFTMFARFTSSSNQSTSFNFTEGQYYKINWGDAQIEQFQSSGPSYITHNYYNSRTQRWYVSNSLDHVLQFNCSYNDLTGDISLPSNCRYLNYFDCSHNSLSQGIDSVATNIGLEFFDCSYNQFDGYIPSLQNNIVLDTFICSSNNLVGNIPNISNNINLISFICDNNQLDGYIPSLIDNINLTSFHCNNNLLSGNIPSLSENTGLISFRCNDNSLIGSIPELTNNVILEEFICSDNEISEYATSILCPNLINFRAHNNYLSSVYLDQILADFITDLNQRPSYGYIDLRGPNNGIPSAQGLYNKLSLIDYGWDVYTNTGNILFATFTTPGEDQSHDILVDNGIGFTFDWGDGNTDLFTGTGTYEYVEHAYLPGTYTINVYLENITSIQYYDCYRQGLYGNVPNISDASSLEYLDCGRNYLTGEIPSLDNCVNLVYFSCYENSLTGNIPSLTNNINLEDFECESNQLTGSIPSLSTNINLIYFFCSDNQLTGSIPNLSSNVSLGYFLCDNNQLTGSIPSLTNNISLRNFYCNDNQLTGSIPNLDNCEVLRTFACDNNALTGSIPTLNNYYLGYFYCNNNQLTGNIPELSNFDLREFICNDNLISGYTSSNINTYFTNFQAQNNLLPTIELDKILSDFNTNLFNRPNWGYIDLSGTGNEAPSVTGMSYRSALIEHGWIVLVNDMPYILYATFQYDYDLNPYFWLDIFNDASYYVDWGDGDSTNYTGTGSWQTLSHVYSFPGTYEIKLYVISKDDIERFDLDRSSFKGEFPNFSNSSNLTQIYSGGYEEFYGDLNITNCTSLQYLYMQYSGFPESTGGNLIIENTPNLEEIYAQGNYFYGSLPDISGLTNLTDFEVIENNFTGNIPDLSGCTSLLYIDVGDNNLSGNVPNLPNSIRSAYFYNNQLTEYTSQSLPISLRYLSVDGNLLPELELDKILQDFISNLASRPTFGAIYLRVANNVLPSVSGLINKKTIQTHGLSIYINSVTLGPFTATELFVEINIDPPYTVNWGDGVIENKTLSAANHAYVAGPNNIYITIPDVTDFTYIFMQSSSPRFSGILPTFTKCTTLQQIQFSVHEFSGNIPSLSDNISLQIIRVNDNKFTGYTSSNLSLSLRQFYAHNNLLTQEAVDQILADFITNVELRSIGLNEYSVIYLNGTGNSPPSAAGIVNKNILISYGWNVFTN